MVKTYAKFLPLPVQLEGGKTGRLEAPPHPSFHLPTPSSFQPSVQNAPIERRVRKS